jgi:N-acetylneuraminic acid mutarotase
MKSFSLITATILIAGVLVFNSCQKELSCINCDNNPTQGNKPPLANAGRDTTIIFNDNDCGSVAFNITLNASSSFDQDGNIVSFAWSGPGTIANPGAAITQVTGLSSGNNQFVLKVTDNQGSSGLDTVVFNLINGNRPFIQARLVPLGILSDAAGAVTVAAAGNKILFAGGWATRTNNPLGGEASSRVDIYDIVTHAWTTAELSVARTNIAVAVCGNKIFFAGGGDTDEATFTISYPNVDVYDVATNTWSVLYLSKAASGLAGASVGNKVLFGGGYDPLVNGGNSIVEIYDLSTNSWSVTPLSERRFFLSAVSIGNKVYFAGGSFNSRSSNRIDIYDNNSGTWSTGSMIEPKTNMASIALNGKIYWAGGENSSSSSSKLVEVKDVSTQQSVATCLFEPNHHFDAVAKNNQIVFFSNYGASKDRFDIYDVTNNTWSIGLMNVEVSNAAIISVNNIIYVASGNIGNTFPRTVYKLEF